MNDFHQRIEMLRWDIELGRIDIMTEVITLSQHLCNPGVNHLEAAYNIYHYMRKNINLNLDRVGFDPT